MKLLCTSPQRLNKQPYLNIQIDERKISFRSIEMGLPKVVRPGGVPDQ
jgi:hypothetical protein